MKLISTFLLVLFFFLSSLVIGCSVPTSQVENNSNLSLTSNQTIAEENTSVSSPSDIAVQNPTSCQEQWRCVSASTLAHQEGNCTFKNKQTCPLGCNFENNSCKTLECKEGYGCRTPSTKAYQDKYCSWMLEEKCEFGCWKGACLNATEAQALNTTDNATKMAKPAPPVYDPYAGVQWINVGESVEFSMNGKNNTQLNHTLSILAIEDGRVIMKVDTLHSDWVREGETAKFLGGTIFIDIREIQFQSFEGGVRKVGYKLSTS